MFKKIHWKQYLPYASVAAIVYCIPVIVFLRNASYTQSWLLYLGNFLFLAVIVTFLFSFNRKRHQNASTVSMLAAGHITTVMSILISVLICLVLIFLLVPGLFQPGMADKAMTNAPANIIKGNTNGLVFEVIANAIVGNIAAGSFASIVFSFTLKGDQTSEDVSPQQKQL